MSRFSSVKPQSDKPARARILRLISLPLANRRSIRATVCNAFLYSSNREEIRQLRGSANDSSIRESGTSHLTSPPD